MSLSYEMFNCVYFYTFTNFIQVYMCRGSLPCIPGTHPEMKDEVKLQQSDKPCGWEGLKLEKLMESSYGIMSRAAQHACQDDGLLVQKD